MVTDWEGERAPDDGESSGPVISWREWTTVLLIIAGFCYVAWEVLH